MGFKLLTFVYCLSLSLMCDGVKPSTEFSCLQFSRSNLKIKSVVQCEEMKKQIIEQKDFIPLLHYIKAWNRNEKAAHLLEYIWKHINSNLIKLKLLTQILSVFPDGVSSISFDETEKMMKLTKLIKFLKYIDWCFKTATKEEFCHTTNHLYEIIRKEDYENRKDKSYQHCEIKNFSQDATCQDELKRNKLIHYLFVCKKNNPIQFFTDFYIRTAAFKVLKAHNSVIFNSTFSPYKVYRMLKRWSYTYSVNNAILMEFFMVTQSKEYFFLPNFTRLYLKQTQNKIVLFKTLTNCNEQLIGANCTEDMLNFYKNGFLTGILCDNYEEINHRIVKVFIANISDDSKLLFFDQLLQEIEYICDNFAIDKISTTFSNILSDSNNEVLLRIKTVFMNRFNFELETESKSIAKEVHKVVFLDTQKNNFSFTFTVQNDDTTNNTKLDVDSSKTTNEEKSEASIQLSFNKKKTFSAIPRVVAKVIKNVEEPGHPEEIKIILKDENSSQTVISASQTIIQLEIHEMESSDLEVKLKFPIDQKNVETGYKAFCAFWVKKNNNSEGFWSTEGMKVLSSSETHIICHSNHLTNFAVFFALSADPQNDLVQSKPLRWITVIGCLSSIICQLLTISVIEGNLYKGKQFYRAFSIINLTIAMFALNLLSVISELIYTSTEACKYLAPLLHLTLFSVFTWITCDTIYIFLSVVFPMVANFSLTKLKFASLSIIIGWFVPGTTVFLAYMTENEMYNRKDSVCWIHPSKIMFYITIVFSIILSLNFCMFLVIIRRLFRSGKNVNKKQNMETSQAFYAFTFFLSSGATWFLGLFISFTSSSEIARTFFTYFHTIVNSFLGVLLFWIFVGRTKNYNGRFLKMIQRFSNYLSCCSQTKRTRSYYKKDFDTSFSSTKLMNTNSTRVKRETSL